MRAAQKWLFLLSLRCSMAQGGSITVPAWIFKHWTGHGAQIPILHMQTFTAWRLQDGHFWVRTHTQDKQPTCLLLIGPLPEGCAEPVPQHVGENGPHHAEEEEAMDAHDDDDEQEDTDSDVAIARALGPQ